MTKISHFRDYLAAKQREINEALQSYLIGEGPESLWEAMRYSMFIGGKRLRPVLALAATELCKGDAAQAMPTACAIEMIHTYSLIHDDLPAMDDDDLRRGEPTNHKVFGEATAILAGDTLMTYAYELIVRESLRLKVSPAVIVRIIQEVAEATGTNGMAGGQILDMEGENRQVSLTELERIHRLKTGALIRACVRCGALIAGADGQTLERLTVYAEQMGLLFQIVDDILDVTGTTEVLGKPAGSDEKNNKATYVSLLGLEEARRRAREAADAAREAIAPLGGEQNFLNSLIGYFLQRDS